MISGLGYRRIAKRLRDMNIKTIVEVSFKNNNVFAVIKRYFNRYVLERYVIESMSINGDKNVSDI